MYANFYVSDLCGTPNNLYCRQVDHRHQLQRSMQHLADPLADILALIVHLPVNLLIE